jgi:hypothetical protein
MARPGPDRIRKKNWRPAPPAEDSIRRRLYRILEAGHIFNWKILLFETSLISLIIANVVAVTLDSVKNIGDRYVTEFYWFETISVVIFAFELCRHFHSERAGFARPATVPALAADEDCALLAGAQHTH